MWRAVAWAYGLLFVIFMLTTGKQIYYLAGVYVTLLAVGAVSVDGWLRERPVRLRRLAVATAVTTLVPVLVVLPVLPPSDVEWTYNLSAVSGGSIGWPQLVSTVRASWLSIPPRERANNIEWDDHIYLCTGPRHPWGQMWPSLRHYD